MSDMFKLVNAMELAKKARVGMELTYFDVIELLGELESLKDYIAELEAERRWIPVREKPLEPGTFLVLWKNGDIRKDWTYIDGGRYYWWNSGQSNVTHWMPLPEPPEVQE